MTVPATTNAMMNIPQPRTPDDDRPATTNAMMNIPQPRTPDDEHPATDRRERVRGLARYALAALLIFAGLSHFLWARTSFRAQVPGWVPGDVDTVVLVSGAVEVALGIALIRVRSRWMGWIVGAFFLAVFPGNISQLVEHKDAFGLDSDARRGIRLLFQPVLVGWAIWSTAEHPDATPTTRACPGSDADRRRA